MRIIDTHTHLGLDCVFDVHFTLEELLVKHEACGISVSIVQPGTCHDLETVREQHNRIAALIRESNGLFAGMANPNPHLPDAVYEAEVRRCIEELGFIAIKLHPLAHAANPNSRDGRKVFAAAEKLKVPVMVHTGAGIPFANPCNLIPVAEAFPGVAIILAHCGGGILASEIPVVLNRCKNVYGEASWTGGHLIKSWSDTIGADRFMLGSDHADNAATEITKVRTCGLTDEQQEWIFCKTAESVFGLNR